MGKRALLIVDHGSKRREANELLAGLAEMVQKMSGWEIVRYAHMELAEPTIQQAFADCVRGGASEIIVHPYFLSPGEHATQDIPMLVAEAASKSPGVSFRVTEPLGLHPLIAKVILDRVGGSLESNNQK